MIWNRFTQYFFAPPTHQRRNWLYGYLFGMFWLFIAFGHDFRFPYVLLPFLYFVGSTAEVLPRTWILPAALLRCTVILVGTIGLLYAGLTWQQWFPQS